MKKLSKSSKVVLAVVWLMILVLCIVKAISSESLFWMLTLTALFIWDACWFIDLTTRKEL
jgi:hypothetical protein